jgi:hypothetical protein
MDLKDIAAVSGKSGLFKVIKPTRTGVILESLDEAKKKSIASGNSRVSVLKEISVYTTGEESSILLEDLFDKILAKHGKDLDLDHKAESSVLFKFLSGILPDYDEDRVYASDLKKMVLWYKTIAKNYPEIFEATKDDKKSTSKTATKKPAVKKKAAPKKITAKKPAVKKATPKINIRKSQ